jgi:hypothetical protein
MEEPIVILGNQRSGTSLTRQILTNHSQIAIPPESHFFAFLEDRFESHDNIRIEVYINLLRNCQKIEHWGLDFDHLHEYLLERKLKNYADVIAETYKYWGRINGKDSFMWGDKNSLWFEKLDIYKKYYEPKVIHLIRDPRDIAVSYLHLSSSRFDSTYAPKLTTSIREIGEKWNRNNNSIRQLYGDGKYVCIRYEDIVLNPEVTVEKLLKFIGVETESDYC